MEATLLMARAKPTGRYRSALESKVAKLLGAHWQYEGPRINYTMYRKYIPDFTYEDIVIEVKGFFRPGDQAKYMAIKDQLDKDGKRFIMVFPNVDKPVRKGAKLTHGKWCEKNGIEYYSVSEIQKSF
jgi:hypothetical protein